MANSEFQPTENSFVYLGSRSEDDVVYWGIDVSEDSSLVPQFGAKHFGFVELRTLMVATDWTDERAMSDLAIAGHVSGYDFWMRVHLFASFFFFFFWIQMLHCGCIRGFGGLNSCATVWLHYIPIILDWIEVA